MTMNVLGLMNIPFEVLILIVFIFGIPLLIGIISWRHTRKKVEHWLQNVADIFNFQKRGDRQIKGIYNNKEITITDTIFRTTTISVVSRCIRIETDFYDPSEPKFLTKPYFSLTRKISNLKWNGFEDTFNINGNVVPLFTEEIKSDIEYLFYKGYFNQFTSLMAWPPNKAYGQRSGRVVFELPWAIIQDIDSLRKAINIVIKIAAQMSKAIM